MYCSVSREKKWICTNGMMTMQLVRSKNGVMFEIRKHWGLNFTNMLNLVALALFVPGAIFLNITPADAAQEAQEPYLQFGVTGAVCMASSWFFFAMRILHFYSINKQLGPCVLMIGKMVRFSLLSTRDPDSGCILLEFVLRTVLCLAVLSGYG